MIAPFEFNDLTVLRKSDLGFMLTDGNTEVLLHFKEANGNEYTKGDTIKVFIYLDKEGRLNATLNEPTVTMSKPGFAEVVESVSNLGVFVNINVGKDILISKDYLPYDFNLWPEIGSKLFVELKVKKNQPSAKIVNRFEIIDNTPDDTIYHLDDIATAYVVRSGDEGVGAITEDGAYIFIHKTHLRQKYKLGETIYPKIIKVNGVEYNGTLTDNKEYMIDPDSEMLLKYIEAHGGTIPYTAKSSAQEIETEFKISRKAFKRALGALYKGHKVICTDTETKLNVKENKKRV